MKQTVTNFQLILKKTLTSTKKSMSNIFKLLIKSLKLNLNSNTITLMKIWIHFINLYKPIIRFINKKTQMHSKFYIVSLTSKSLKKKIFHTEKLVCVKLIQIPIMKIMQNYKMIYRWILWVNKMLIKNFWKLLMKIQIPKNLDGRNHWNKKILLMVLKLLFIKESMKPAE